MGLLSNVTLTLPCFRLSSNLHLPIVSSKPQFSHRDCGRARIDPVKPLLRSPIRSSFSLRAAYAMGSRSETEIFVSASEEELAISLAEYTANLSDKFVKERGAFSVVLSGGSLIKALRFRLQYEKEKVSRIRGLESGMCSGRTRELCPRIMLIATSLLMMDSFQRFQSFVDMFVLSMILSLPRMLLWTTSPI